MFVEFALLKTWFESMRTRFGKLFKSGDGNIDHTERDQWILDHFDFLHTHIVRLRGQQADGLKTKLEAKTSSDVHLPLDWSDDEEEEVDLSLNGSCSVTPVQLQQPPSSPVHAKMSKMLSTGKSPVVKSSSKSSLPVPSVMSVVEQRVEDSRKLPSRVDTVLTGKEQKGKCTREAWG